MHDVDWVPASDKATVGDHMRQICGACPVAVECLAYALSTDSHGIWAATNKAQRNALLRRRSRARCPVCRRTEPVDLSAIQICIWCGASWDKPEIPGQRSTADCQGDAVGGAVSQ
jgi:hypothetical protein